MTRLEITYHLSRDRDVSLDTLVQDLVAYQKDFSDPEQINDAWIQVTEEGEVIHEAQPYSLSIFLEILTTHFQLFLSGKTIWLFGLESTFVFRATANELELYFWKDVPINQLKPLISREITKGICFKVRGTPEQMPRYAEASYRLKLSKRDWLATILTWGQDFTRLLQEAKSWIAANPGLTSSDSAQALQEISTFLPNFSKCESAMTSSLASMETGEYQSAAS